MNLYWIFLQFLPAIGFLLAVVLLSVIIRQRRSPTSTLAWLLSIVFIPYVAVPLYILIGGRKVKRRIEAKHMLPWKELELPEAIRENPFVMTQPGYGVFPPMSRNRVTILTRGVQAYESYIRKIRNAETTIFVTTYLLRKDATGDAILEALTEKALKGVKVRFLVDDLGCMHLRRTYFSPLVRAGAKVAFFMPMIHLPVRSRANLRNHRKMLLVDNQTAIIGGMNLAMEYMGARPYDKRWRDLNIEIQGPIVSHLYEIFRADWWFAAEEDLPPPDHTPLIFQDESPDDAGCNLQVIASGPDVENDSIRDMLLSSIFRAKKRIWIVTPYFVPDEFMVESLCIMARKNMDVRLIIPRRSNHRIADIARGSYLRQLHESGVRVLFYRPRMLHAKAILIDDDLGVVGSANLDMRSLLLNYEVALLIYTPKVVSRLEAWMRIIMTECFPGKNSRNTAIEYLEGIGRLFAPLL